MPLSDLKISSVATGKNEFSEIFSQNLHSNLVAAKQKGRKFRDLNSRKSQVRSVNSSLLLSEIDDTSPGKIYRLTLDDVIGQTLEYVNITAKNLSTGNLTD